MLYQEQQLCILDNVSSDERNWFITCNSRVRQLLWLLTHGIPDAATLFILVFFTYPEKLPRSRVSWSHFLTKNSWPKPRVSRLISTIVAVKYLLKSPLGLCSSESYEFPSAWFWLLLSSCRACCCAKGRREIRTNRLEYPSLISIGLFCWFSMVESMFSEHSAAESCPVV